MLNIKNDLVLLIVASIILALVIPGGGLLRDYTTEYCNEDFSSNSAVGDQNYSVIDSDYPLYLNKDVGFFSCEIGYIGGYVQLQYLLNFPISFDKEIFIFDYSNYIDYLNGKTFGVNNFDLNFGPKNILQDYSSVRTTLPPSNYFFVIDWNYRTPYESEEVERPYFLDHKAPEDICPTGLDENYMWEDSNCIMFNYYLDIDYIDT